MKREGSLVSCHELAQWFFSHLPIGTLFALLLASRLVADCGTQMNTAAIWQPALGAAEEHAQTALLQYVDVVVVGVPHGPTAGMLLGILTLGGVDQATMSIGPIIEVIMLAHRRHNRIIDIPFDLSARRARRRTR